MVKTPWKSKRIFIKTTSSCSTFSIQGFSFMLLRLLGICMFFFVKIPRKRRRIFRDIVSKTISSCSTFSIPGSDILYICMFVCLFVKIPWKSRRIFWNIAKDNFLLLHLLHPRLWGQINLMWSYIKIWQISKFVRKLERFQMLLRNQYISRLNRN